MPEGDTVYRSAETLGRALSGATLTGVSAEAPRLRRVGLQRVVGQQVARVEARGKHLLVWFTPSGRALHTHLGMSGSWHLYRPGQRWRKPAGRASVALETAEWVAVCFSAAVCELRSADAVERHPGLASLGPDAARGSFDASTARRRLDARGDWAVAEALLDQRVLCGVGNVFKSEVLFLQGVDPWELVRTVPSPTRDALLATAARLVRANAVTPATARTTTDPPDAAPQGGRLYVYGRAGRPCRRCGTAVLAARQGAQARLTYWCSSCQQSKGPGRSRGP